MKSFSTFSVYFSIIALSCIRPSYVIAAPVPDPLIVKLSLQVRENDGKIYLHEWSQDIGEFEYLEASSACNIAGASLPNKFDVQQLILNAGGTLTPYQPNWPSGSGCYDFPVDLGQAVAEYTGGRFELIRRFDDAVFGERHWIKNEGGIWSCKPLGSYTIRKDRINEWASTWRSDYLNKTKYHTRCVRKSVTSTP